LGRAAYRHLQRDNNVRARSTRSPPRPLRNHVPLARPMIPWRLPCFRSTSGIHAVFRWRGPAKPCRGQRAVRGTTESGFASDREPQVSLEPAEVQPRTDRPEAKGSQPFGLLASSPPSKAAEHPFCRQPAATEAWRASAAPPVVRRAQFPGWRGTAFGITGWPRSPFRRLPAKADAFPKTRVLSTDRRRARGKVALLLVRVSLSVTPPSKGIAIGRPALFVLFPSASP